MKISKDEAEILDYILKEVLLNGPTRVDSLKPLEKDIYSNISSVKNSDYSGYIEILVEEKLIKHEKWSENTQTIQKIPGRTQNFIDSGGYTELFKNKQLDKKTDIDESRHTTINANQVIYNEQSNYGNQSLSDNALASPTTQTTNEMIDKTPKRSWIELLSWIFGSIASIFAIYEFVIKRIFENN